MHRCISSCILVRRPSALSAAFFNARIQRSICGSLQMCILHCVYSVHWTLDAFSTCNEAAHFMGKPLWCMWKEITLDFLQQANKLWMLTFDMRVAMKFGRRLDNLCWYRPLCMTCVHTTGWAFPDASIARLSMLTLLIWTPSATWRLHSDKICANSLSCQLCWNTCTSDATWRLDYDLRLG